MLLSGLNALVTGASSGIGYGIAKTLCNNGAYIFAVGRNKEALQKLSDELNGNCKYFVCDIANSDNIVKMILEIESTCGKIDILVNNAGMNIDKLSIRTTDDDWNRVINTNLTSNFIISREVAKYMLKRKSGKIISISSIIGFTGNIGQCSYSASKAGIIALTKSMAKEFASRGITVNAIAPGYIDTAMTNAIPDNIKEDIIKLIPMKRTGSVEEVAEAVLFLSSKHASYITGQVIHINGGMYM